VAFNSFVSLHLFFFVFFLFFLSFFVCAFQALVYHDFCLIFLRLFWLSLDSFIRFIAFVLFQMHHFIFFFSFLIQLGFIFCLLFFVLLHI